MKTASDLIRTPKTGEDVAKLLRDNMESAEPQSTILAYFRRNHGKTLTVRDEAKLRQETGNDSIRIVKSHGTTDIRWGEARPGMPDSMQFMTAAYAVKNVVMDADFLVQNNERHYGAAVARNAKREAALVDPAILEEAAMLAEVITSARRRLKDLLDGPLSSDFVAIGKLLGLDG